MESKIRYVLKHKETGLYYSRIAQQTPKLFDAWRFYSEDEAAVWMEVSYYKPEYPDEYELIPVKQMIEEVTGDVPQERIHKEYSGSVG